VGQWRSHARCRAEILAALDDLRAGGSTNGGAGIQAAYGLARAHFQPEGVNRVILCTDGDFNVGITDPAELQRFIQTGARLGVYLSVLGFGAGNYKDSTLERLADRGNGNYAYVDTLGEAHRVLVGQMTATLVTVARDVKAQVEFNPARVRGYRLLGYENRALRPEDFNNDRKDGGEPGAGHSVTVLYEIAPVPGRPRRPSVDPLRYQPTPVPPRPDIGLDELLTVKIRYQEPAGTESRLLEFPLADRGQTYARASGDFKFAAGVAAFGLILRDSPHKGAATLGGVLELAGEGLDADPYGHRRELLELVRHAEWLQTRRPGGGF
jgi:Ca-activated chloride channel family protein